MNIFENYYGKPQGNVNLYGFNLPLEYYNCLWKEDDKTHTQPLIMLCKGQEVVPRANATDLVDKIYKLCNVINRSIGDLNQKNSHIEFLENQLQKYKSNEDKKNELILTNNDVMKNNQEMEKINTNREDRLLEKIDKVKENYKEEYKELLEIIKDSKDEKYINKMKEVCNDMKLVLKYIDKESPVYEYIIEKYNL